MRTRRADRHFGVVVAAAATCGTLVTSWSARVSAQSFESAYQRLAEARVHDGGREVIPAARELVRLAGARSDDDAGFALLRAAEVFDGARYDDDAIVTLHRLVAQLRPRLGREDGARFVPAILVRAFTIGARVLERRGRTSEAIDYADRARSTAIDHGLDVSSETSVIIARIAYAHGERDRARAALWTVVRDPMADSDARFEAMSAALAADDWSSVRDAAESMERAQLVGDQWLEIARIRLMLARSYAEHGAMQEFADQLGAVRRLESRSGALLLEPAANVVLQSDLDQFERALEFTLMPMRCDTSGRVLATAIGSMQARLAMATGLRRRIELFGVASLSLRARLREAAIFEAAAVTLDRAPAQCLAERDAGNARDLTAQAEALEREANRIERHDRHRADAMRVEALLLRERASSGAPPGAAADVQQLAALRDEQRSRSRESVMEASRIAASMHATEPRLSDPDAPSDMAVFIARAVNSWSRTF